MIPCKLKRKNCVLQFGTLNVELEFSSRNYLSRFEIGHNKDYYNIVEELFYFLIIFWLIDRK